MTSATAPVHYPHLVENDPLEAGSQLDEATKPLEDLVCYICLKKVGRTKAYVPDKEKVAKGLGKKEKDLKPSDLDGFVLCRDCQQDMWKESRLYTNSYVLAREYLELQEETVAKEALAKQQAEQEALVKQQKEAEARKARREAFLSKIDTPSQKSGGKKGK